MRSLFTRAAIAAAVLAAVVLAFALLTLPPAHARLGPAAWTPLGRRSVVAGAYHVHTRWSDGTGTPDAVAAAAARAGLRFVIFTDHGDGIRPPDPPQYRHGVLCLDGVEVSTRAGHYVALGIGQAPYPLGGEGRDVIEDVARLGGFGIVAHPESARRALRWTEWASGIRALEWLNADSAWRDERVPRLAHALLEYFFRPPESIIMVFNRPAAALARWDRMTRAGPVVALAAHDAHARIGPVREADPSGTDLALPWPSYESVFRAFALRAELESPFTGSAEADAAALLAALRAGHTYAAIDALAAPVAFEFVAEAGGRVIASEGDRVAAGTPFVLHARASAAPGVSIVLFRDGAVVDEVAGDRLERAIDGAPAVYRVEVHLPPANPARAVPWIVSNPIYVGGPLEAPAVAGRRPATRAAQLAEGPPAWRIEKDASSTGGVHTLDGEATGAGEGQGPGFRFTYRLGEGARASQYAAVAHDAGDLSGYDRIAFRGRADGPMRLSVQVRRSGAAGGERWQRSVYLDGTPRDVEVFFDDMRPIGPTSQATPDPARIDGVLLVVDTTNALPGAHGTVRIEGLRVEGAGQGPATGAVGPDARPLGPPAGGHRD